MTTAITALRDLDLRVGSYRYGTTRAFFDGSVGVEGVRTTRMSTGATLPDIFQAFVNGDVDVSELGLTFLLRALEAGAPYVALPAFPNRVFRHSCVFVNADAGIDRPQDLVGRTIGEFGVYGQDSGVWAKGILMDDFDFRPEDNRWVIGGLDHPSAPFEWTAHPVPDGLDISPAPDGRTLSQMLLTGEIDALFSANIPQPVLHGTARIRRLFPDYVDREREWYLRTGIFPIMHTVVVRRDLLEAHPDLARKVYEAFRTSKQKAVDELAHSRLIYQVPSMLPWLDDLYERDVAMLGEDWWPYGLAANRPALKTYLRYHHEQGLSKREWTVDELFATDLLDS